MTPTLPAPPAFSAPGFAIGPLAVASRALMAPMMGYNEAPLRRICRSFGSGLAVTEMVKPEKLLRRDPNVLRDLGFGEDERPLGVQVAMRAPDLLLPAVRELVARGYDFVDLNMGCPLKKECGKGWGAALLQRPDEAARLVGAVVEAAGVPVTVKVRAGYELGELQGPDVAAAAVRAGALAVCVHGRTKMGWYREQVSLPAIRAVVEALDGAAPVIGNGDVTSLERALVMFRDTGCDAVMIGRGAIGNPWLFGQVDRYLRRGEVLPDPGWRDVRLLYGQHMDAVQQVFGERKGFSQVRRYAFHYFGRFGLAGEWRRRIAVARDRADLDAVLDAAGAAAAA